MSLKLKKIKFILLSLLRFIVKGKANKKINHPNKFLIIQTSKLGDMVCVTPLFRAIKQKFPDGRIFVISNKINGYVIENNKDVDNFYELSHSIKDQVKKIKEIAPDFACILSPNFNMLAAMYLSGVPIITAPTILNGYSPIETKSYRFLRKFVITKPHKMEHYAPREYLRLLEPLGINSSNTKKHLAFSSTAEKKTKEVLKDHQINFDEDFLIGISPSAGNKVKEWQPEKFARLMDHIYEDFGHKIIITGEDKVDEVIKLLDKNTQVINTAGKLSIDELKYLISKLKIFIGVDTGPIYIAEAFDIATIDIIGPMDEREQPPTGPKNKIVKINRDKPAIHIMNARVYDKAEARRQIEEISVDQVMEKYKELLEERL